MSIQVGTRLVLTVDGVSRETRVTQVRGSWLSVEGSAFTFWRKSLRVGDPMARGRVMLTQPPKTHEAVPTLPKCFPWQTARDLQADIDLLTMFRA